jgi:hypothetical protein
METGALFRHYFEKLESDERITISHISLLMALFFHFDQSGQQNPISVTRRKVMQTSHVYSIATYHKSMKDLVRFGYIRYFPSYNRFLGSLVYFNLVAGI